MKIAICISGLLRSYRKTIDGFKHHVMPDGHDYDVFISTWREIDSNKSAHVVRRGGRHADGLVSLQELYDMLDPIAVDVEKQPIWDSELVEKYEKRRREDMYVPGTLNMLYKIFTADLLRRRYEYAHDFKYDIVVRTRLDLKFGEVMDYDLDGHDIAIPEMWAPTCPPFDLPWLSDLFAYGPSYEMTIYSTMLFYVDEMFGDGLPFQAEVLTHEWMRRNKLSVKLLKLPEVVRP